MAPGDTNMATAGVFLWIHHLPNYANGIERPVSVVDVQFNRLRGEDSAAV